MTVVLNKLISHSSIYFAGNILRYSVSFVMLPIYTRMLTPADFGIVELLGMIIDFSGILFGLRIGEAIFRFYLDADNRSDRQSIISTSLLLLVGLNGLGVLLLNLLAEPLSTHLLGGPENRSLLLMFSVTLLFHPLVEIPMTFIRARQKPWLYVAFSTLKLALQLALNIYFVVILKMHVEGVVISSIISGGVMSLILSSYTLWLTGIRFSVVHARLIVSFSYPLVLASLLTFYVTFGDRYFLQYFGGLEEVGIYALGYKFGFMLSFMVTGPFFKVWDSEKYLILKRPDARNIYRQTFAMFNAFTLLIVVLISVFAKNLLIVMADSAFWEAARIVPIILMAYFLQGWTAFCNLGIMIERKTMIITQSTALAALIISVGYLTLIPAFGAVGAAWATVSAFAGRFIYIHVRSRRLYDMQLPWRKILLVFPPALVAILLSQFTSDQFISSAIANLLIICGLLAFYIFFPFLPLELRSLLRRVVVRPWRLGPELRRLLNGRCEGVT